jgi:DNA-binding IclR family transcriptional regulator
MKSINKTLDVLEVFLTVKESKLRLSEIARLAGINKSTVNRIVIDLRKRLYLQQSEKRGKYSLGPQFVKFSQMMDKRMQFGAVSRPHMVKLSKAVRECVLLTALDVEEAIISDVIDSVHVLKVAPLVGMTIPLYCTAQGKAILAYMKEPELEKYLMNVTRKKFTENTVTNAAELRAHLIEVVRENAAYDNEEQYLGLRNVAVPIKDANNEVYTSVGVLGPSTRLTMERMKGMVPDVQKCALAISRDLGYTDGS